MIKVIINNFKIIFRINFDDPTTTRPGSLAKSAVLAALEEEEKQKGGNHIGKKILNF